jgi:hypothetical protein
MQEVPPLGSDLPVYLASQRLAASPLRASQLRSRLPDVARILDLLPGGQCREFLQAKVDPDFTGFGWKAICDLADEIEIPAACGVLAEAARPNIAGDRPRQPKPVLPAKVRSRYRR